MGAAANTGSAAFAALAALGVGGTISLYQHADKHIARMLSSGEVIEKAFVQRMLPYLGGSLTAPTSVFCTNKRLIIVHRVSLSVQMEYEMIPYDQIVAVRHDHGFFSSSVYLHLQGYHRAHGFAKGEGSEGEINGLRNKDADELVEYLNGRESHAVEREETLASGGAAPEEKPHSHAEAPGAYLYCGNCGHKNSIGAAHCSECGAKLAP